MSAYDWVFDKVLTRTDAEQAHRAAFTAIRALRPVAPIAAPRHAAVSVMGIEFPEILGLAAGFDKNGEAIDQLAALGFGFVEIGTVTAQPQPGNPKPRLFRLPADQAIVNRMGFNNHGAQVVADRLAKRAARRHVDVPLGINIGKTKVVPEDDQAAVVADHLASATLLAPYADYLVVNVSSPNTPGLRSLQAVDRLQPILEAVGRRADDVADRHVPLLVKIAPDLADADIVAVADMAKTIGLDGIIATNTTIGREGLTTPASEVAAIGAGGLSGAPLRERSQSVLRLLRAHVGNDLAIISAGGVMSVDDAHHRIDDGADLVQAYTGFIYGGPLWPRRVSSALCTTSQGSKRIKEGLWRR